MQSTAEADWIEKTSYYYRYRLYCAMLMGIEGKV